MALISGKSKESFKSDVDTELKTDKSGPKSLAIAYSVQRQNKGKKLAPNGPVSSVESSSESYTSIADAILGKKKALRPKELEDSADDLLEDNVDTSVDDSADLADDLDEDPVPEPTDMISRIRNKLKAKRGL